MLKVFQLILAPAATWQGIATAKPSILRLLAGTYVPLAALCLLVEYQGLTRWEGPLGDLGIRGRMGSELAMRYCLTQAIGALGMLFLGALVIHWLCEGFHFKASFAQCFTLAVYGLSPFLLARALDAFPGIHTWVCWAMGALLCFSVLYQGTGAVLQPDQTKGFGMYLLSSWVLILLSGLAHFVAVSVLDGRVWR